MDLEFFYLSKSITKSLTKFPSKSLTKSLTQVTKSLINVSKNDV